MATTCDLIRDDAELDADSASGHLAGLSSREADVIREAARAAAAAAPTMSASMIRDTATLFGLVAATEVADDDAA